MMDKKQKIALVMLPVLSFAILIGCTRLKPEPATEAGVYTDGTFEGIGTGFSGDVKAQVVVENGNIKEIKVLEHKETPGLGDKAMDTVIASIVETQEVDAEIVTGATKSSQAVIQAVKIALGLEEAAAEAPAETTVEPMTFVDGTYEGAAKGFKSDIKVKVVVAGTKISTIEVLAMGETAGIGDVAVNDTIAKIIEAQSTEVDAVSGATLSSKAVLNAVKAALASEAVADSTAQAPAPAPAQPKPAPAPAPAPAQPKPAPAPAPAQPKPAPAPAGQFKDGTYRASNKETFYGEAITATVTVSGGRITNVKIDTTDTPEIGGAAVKLIAANVVSKQAGNVDVVSGSTITSKGAIKAVQDAINQAK